MNCVRDKFVYRLKCHSFEREHRRETNPLEGCPSSFSLNIKYMFFN